MAYVIAVAGAGGKSWYIDRVADIYAVHGLNVCITTTTHIFRLPNRRNVIYAGKPEGVKLSYLGDYGYEYICRNFDAVLVESDGSHHCPVKIPAEYEPVIPSNANEIVIVMGHHSCGRITGEVCQRFNDDAARRLIIGEGTPITGRIIDAIAYEYYINPLQKKFPSTKIKYFRNNLTASIKDYYGMNIALVLMCSGKSERFGSNKLMYQLDGRKIFSYGLEALISAKFLLDTDGINSQVFVTGGNEELERCVKDRWPGTVIIPNALRHEGISGSVRCGAETAMNYGFDAVLFLAGDMPFFPADDISRLVKEFLCSGKLYGCAYSSYPSNPAIFRPECYSALLGLTGDKGALKLIRDNPEKTYYYVVSKNKLQDIDTIEDINARSNLQQESS